MTEKAAMPAWKKVLLRSFGLGVGFALVLVTVAAFWLYFGSRPTPEKAWNNSAIRATWTDLSISTEEDKCYLNFRYSLENTTDRDYTIPSSAKLMVRLPGDMSYRDNSDMVWEQGGFVPVHQKLNIQIRIPFNYADYSFSKAKADDLKELSKFADRRLTDIDGFALFDQTNRYRVDFPNGWPDAGKRANQQEHGNK